MRSQCERETSVQVWTAGVDDQQRD